MRTMARPWVLAALLALVPAPAAWAQALEPVPDAQSGVVTDGHRLAAYASGSDAATVVDTADGSSRRLSVAAGCEPGDVACGRLLLVCGDAFSSSRPAVVVDARSGRTVGPPPGAISGRWDLLGRYWLSGAVFDMRGDVIPSYLNWRTGRYRRDDGPPRDMNRPTLPILHPPCGAGSARGWFDVPGRRSLLLTRCGRRRPILLSRCRLGYGCRSFSVSAGVATWAEGRAGNVARAYLIARRRALSWRVAGFDEKTSNSPLGVEHTAREIFVSAWGPPATRVYATALPR